ncbi:hypothetical protein BC941DRAFT_415163 [Chlamydoabsidia padenii]|nr:hypothetical protein BC941DRAFT_415163 [Chlamydoabsidia padenii]
MDRMLIKLLDNPSTSTPTLETSSMTMTMAAASLLVMNNSSNDIFPYNGAVWIPSLRELALRYMMNRKRLGNNKDGRISNSNIPWALVDDLQFEMTCNICGGACVNEWLSAIQVKAHQTYSSVVCKVTLCSTACWLIHYRNTRRPGPLSPSLPPPTRSNIALVPDLNPFPPDSFEWIVMAATASALQRQEDQSLE